MFLSLFFPVQRVAKPRGGILQWLPISLYKRIHRFISTICAGLSINATGTTFNFYSQFEK